MCSSDLTCRFGSGIALAQCALCYYAGPAGAGGDARRSIIIKGLIFRHCRINQVRPGQDPSGQIVDLLESSLPQEVYGFRAADSAAAVGHDFFAGVEFVHAVGEIAERDEVSPDVADLVFVGLAHVENIEVVAAVSSSSLPGGGAIRKKL